MLKLHTEVGCETFLNGVFIWHRVLTFATGHTYYAQYLYMHAFGDCTSFLSSLLAYVPTSYCGKEEEGEEMKSVWSGLLE